MAERRMLAKTIIDSDSFLEMPITSQLLYFHLHMRADDEGFINKPKTIMRMLGSKDDDMNVLIAKKFIIPFDSGVVVIKHWRIHNYLQNGRYIETKYVDEKATLELDENNAYRKITGKTPEDYQQLPENYLSSIEKSSIEKFSIEKSSKDMGRFAPPTLDDVMAYAKERKREDLAQAFYDYYSAGDWKDVKGQKVKNWKQKFITWSNHNNTPRNSRQRVEMVSDYSKEETPEMSQEEIEAIKRSFKQMK